MTIDVTPLVSFADKAAGKTPLGLRAPQPLKSRNNVIPLLRMI